VALAAVAFGVEDEAVRIMALQQHHADRGPAVGCRGGERHRFGVVRLTGARLGEPVLEQKMRVGGHAGLLAPGGPAANPLARLWNMPHFRPVAAGTHGCTKYGRSL